MSNGEPHGSSLIVRIERRSSRRDISRFSTITRRLTETREINSPVDDSQNPVGDRPKGAAKRRNGELNDRGWKISIDLPRYPRAL